MGSGASKNKSAENYQVKEEPKGGAPAASLEPAPAPAAAPVAEAAAPAAPAATAATATTAQEKLMNAAFVFVKPHANNAASQQLVSSTLLSKGVKILREGDFSGEQIDKGMLIDQHYYAIASKATILKADQIPVPKDKFLESFGVSWDTVLAENRAFNAMDACTALGVDTAGLDVLWSKTNKIKFGGGFYCGEIKREEEGKPSVFVFNAFFLSMRNKFVAPTASIHYFVVEFDPDLLSWKDFRGKVLGPTDPKNAPPESLRGKMLAEWKTLGFDHEPNVSDNCVHASASPLEGLGERMNWLKVAPEEDAFGAAAIKAGITAETLKAWSIDPQIKGKSIFDQLEDKNVQDCLAVMVALNS